MKDSIESQQITNRKIVIELRYDPNAMVVDKRGTIIQKIVDGLLLYKPVWELDTAEAEIYDNQNKVQAKQIVHIDPQRLSVINSIKGTNESAFHLFKKVFEIFKESVNNVNIRRIGCRIQGSYEAESSNYDNVIHNFQKLFPQQFFFEEFAPKDLLFRAVYQNGQYAIGPVAKEEDLFLKTAFPFQDTTKVPGFIIDTDNYILRSEEKPKLQETMIQDVYLASLSIEKLLFDNLKSL